MANFFIPPNLFNATKQKSALNRGPVVCAHVTNDLYLIINDLEIDFPGETAQNIKILMSHDVCRQL